MPPSKSSSTYQSDNSLIFIDFNVDFISSEEVERCQKWSHNVTQQVDLAFNIFFMVYYFIRVSIYFF